MNVISLLAQLRKAGVKLRVEDGALHINAPEDSIDGGLYEKISSNKAEIIKVLSSLRQPTSTSSTPIERLEPREEYPLSFAQERLWFLSQLEPDNPFYNMQRVVRLRGELNVSALLDSIKEIVQRHEALRTSFATREDQPVQIIDKDFSFELAQDDLSEISPELLESETKARMREEALRPFDLIQGPVVRGKLLRLSESEHVLLLTLHHIVSDGWSLGILLRELGAAYAAFCTGQLPALAKLPIQYTDFAVWQRKWLTGEVLTTQLNYWKKQLVDLLTLELPTDHSRPPVQTFTGARETLVLDHQLGEQLESLSKQEGVTFFMTLLAGFAVLLQRYSGQQDIVVGSPIANRNRSELEGLIGFFINSLVMRTDVSGNPTFRELVKRVNKAALEAYKHQDLPFEKLVEELHPERDQSRNPLFQVIFAVQNAPMAPLELKGLVLEPLSGEVETARSDLECHVWQQPQSLQLDFIYNTDLFEAATIRRMLAHYRQLLEGIVAAPNAQLSALPMLIETERKQLVEEWNQTDTLYPREKTVHELFEKQAAQKPDAVALSFDGQKLTYRELNERANQLAHHLQAQGVGLEVLVGLCIERSLEMVVGILGILKAGGAYVPLDPDYPKERIAFMLDDAKIPLMLSSSSLQGILPQFSGKKICLDSDWGAISQECTADLSPVATADSLIYVIYTSGSTGTPKGVAVPHRAVNRLVCNTNYFQVKPEDRVAQASNVSFDAATFELWGALLNGAQLIAVSKDVLLNSQAFSALLREQRITVLFITTALFNLIARENPTAFSKLRGLMFGGEAVDPHAVRCVLANGSPEHLLHVYGPTESTTFATWYSVEDVAANATTVPIGKPLANTSLYILDEYLKPVPIGVAGELHIGGDGLARGYLDRPELTAERFIQNPFSGDPKARLYKSGDLVRYLPDGNIEFIGRIDHQVKLRGFRIELGEIESALKGHESVQDAVVVMRDDEGDKQLVAYAVPASDAADALSVADLRDFIRQRLPDYMVPSAFMLLESLPLTPNGKVDRKMLPVVSDERQSTETCVEPHTELERQLTDIWRDVLSIDEMSIHDNFFDLGGHSLIATQVVSRIRETLGVELPLGEIFANATIAELAQVVETLRLESMPDEGVDISIKPMHHGDGVVLSFAQQRLWFLNRMEPDSSSYNMSISVCLIGELNVEVLEQSINAIVQRHEALRTHFATVEGQAIQIINEDFDFTLSQQDLSGRPDDSRKSETSTLLQEEALQPFDLAQGPVIRGTLLRLSKNEHILVLSLHHIVFDGWSIGLLLKELGITYSAYSTGQSPVLPKLPIQYADFAVWQRQWLTGEVLQTQLSYWKGQLTDLPTLALSTDHPRPTVQTFVGTSETLELQSELRVQLDSLSKKFEVTLFMTLLTGFAALLQRYTAQNDIVVGTPIANRNRSEVEGLIGFFVNSLVIRTDLSGNPSFIQLLERVKKTTLDAYKHQDLPFEKLVEELQPERDRSRNPLFQVTFALQNASSTKLDLSGLSMQPVASDIQATRFDLEVDVQEFPNSLGFRVIYNTDLFEAATIKRMLKHYQRLLEGIVATPNACVSTLPMLAETECQQLLEEWNHTARVHPRNRTAHELFEAQVESTPDAVALVAQNEVLSYKQLNERANRLANFLQSQGVGPEVLVGLYVERSVEMVVGALGIQKAGGAYVPIDPEYPTQRLSHILEDTQAPVLLTQTSLQGRLPPYSGLTFCLDSKGAQLKEWGEQNPSIQVEASHLAYVIYTSGSTGVPKGVEVTHSGLSNLLYWHHRVYPTNPTDRASNLAGMGFDSSVWELWSFLTAGVSTYLVPDDVRYSPGKIWPWMAQHKITLAYLPTPLAEAALHEPLPEALQLRILFIGGDQLHGRMIDKPLPFKIINLYGPSENTVNTTAAEVDFITDEEPSIGRPIDNVRIYILDKQLQPVPIGVPGELYIGGDGLARGYLNRPELTAEKFIPDLFSDNPNARLYRSGDLACYRPDSNITFIGRIDNQVKIRGFRIELGEIESTLASHNAVKDSVVVVSEKEGDKSLVAYVVTASEMADAELIADLRDFIRQRLPSYMVPSAFMLLECMPLTPNGKVDRKALPSPTPIPDRGTDSSVELKGELETTMAQIWEDVLDIERIYADDMFFDLGGHSLLSIQVVERFEDETGVRIAPANLINHTVRQLILGVEVQTPMEKPATDKKAGRLFKAIKRVFSKTN